MKILLFIMFCLVLVDSGFCQNWFPLEVGNKSLSRYQYSYQGGVYADFYFITVEKDTTIEGQRFFMVHNYSDRDGLKEKYWLRYDKENQKIYLWANDTTVLYMDFNLNHGEQFSFYDPVTGNTTTRTVYESVANHFGKIRNVKGFNPYWYVLGTWIDTIGAKPFGSFIQSLQITNSDTSYYEYGYGPDFSRFVPVLYTGTLSFNFDFWVTHMYSNWQLPVSKDFLEMVFLDGYYLSEDDSIPMPQLFASNLEYLKKRIHINLNSDLLSNGYNFKYKIKAKDKGLIPKFASSPDSGYYQLSTYLTSLDETPIIIEKFSLSQNYPNPFNPSTKISWQSPLGSHQTLKIYDVLGREVATLVNEYRDAGIYEVEFDGSQLSSGVYYYQLKINDYITTRKMLFLK